MKLENWKRLAKIINDTPRTTAITATTTCGDVVRVLSARMDAGGPEVYCPKKRTVYCTHIVNLHSVTIGDVVYHDETMSVPETLDPPGIKTTFGEVEEGKPFLFLLEQTANSRLWARYRKLTLGRAERTGGPSYITIFADTSRVIVPEEAPSAAPSLPEPIKKITFREFL